MPSPADIQDAIRSIRPLPSVAQRILALLQQDDYAVDDLVALVRTEPALVARVMRLCNSASRGLTGEIRSVAQAVGHLGTRNLVQLVMVTCAAGTFDGLRRPDLFDPTALWLHAMATALAAEALARGADTVAPGAAFTLGVLHDVGVLVLDRLAPAAATAAPDDDPDARVAAERAAFGLDHATAAGLLADSWRLPDALATALRGHHDATTVHGDDALAAVLALAERLAPRLCDGSEHEDAAIAASAAAERLALSVERITARRTDATVELNRMVELLNLEQRSNR